MKFRIKPADTFIWNLQELVDFLIANQQQSITIENGTEGCCARSISLYSWIDKFTFSSVTIETSNALEQHDRYDIKLTIPWKFLKVKRPIDQKYHIWNQQAIFGTVYGRPLWHRLGIVAHLLTNHSTISCIGCQADPKNQNQSKLFELNQLWVHDPSSLVKFANIQHQLPCTHINIDQYTPGATLTDGFVQQAERIYQNFLIDIVAETFTSGNCFFITEKTVRPMLLKKPFIIFGSKNYLEYLRQMGFRTFADFWDEDYDGYEGADRYVRILNLIDKLAGKSFDQLESMYWDMQYTLDHNYNLLLTQGYSKTIKEIS
jgi:hypothetical protein